MEIQIPTKEIGVIEKQVDSLYESGKVFIVSSKEDLDKAANIRTKMKEMVDYIEERRTAITKPINASLKSLNALFAPQSDRLKSAIKVIDAQVLMYTKEQEEIARKEEARIAARVEKGTMRADTAAGKLEQIENPIARVQTTDGGRMSFRKIWKVRITDIDSVPREYLVANDRKITDAILKEGLEIPGVEKYEEMTVVGR